MKPTPKRETKAAKLWAAMQPHERTEVALSVFRGESADQISRRFGVSLLTARRWLRSF